MSNGLDRRHKTAPRPLRFLRRGKAAFRSRVTHLQEADHGLEPADHAKVDAILKGAENHQPAGQNAPPMGGPALFVILCHDEQVSSEESRCSPTLHSVAGPRNRLIEGDGASFTCRTGLLPRPLALPRPLIYLRQLGKERVQHPWSCQEARGRDGQIGSAWLLESRLFRLLEYMKVRGCQFTRYPRRWAGEEREG